MEKHSWQGVITSVQPRIRLVRSYDERGHSYHGFALRLEGTVNEEPASFSVGVGEGTQQKFGFRPGMECSGMAVPVPARALEWVDYYRASAIKLIADRQVDPAAGPPFQELPPDLKTYRARGHRRLATRTYDTKCQPCIWGCRMPVTILLDKWDHSLQQYREETFCYGPKSCPFYAPGPTRKVPIRKGPSFEEEDWIDDEATGHRGPDD